MSYGLWRPEAIWCCQDCRKHLKWCKESKISGQPRHASLSSLFTSSILRLKHSARQNNHHKTRQKSFHVQNSKDKTGPGLLLPTWQSRTSVKGSRQLWTPGCAPRSILLGTALYKHHGFDQNIPFRPSVRLGGRWRAFHSLGQDLEAHLYHLSPCRSSWHKPAQQLCKLLFKALQGIWQLAQNNLGANWGDAEFFSQGKRLSKVLLRFSYHTLGRFFFASHLTKDWILHSGRG